MLIEERIVIMERELNTLKIWQQNVNKSRVCQHDILSSGKLAREGIDIVALQEPAINHFATMVTTNDWTVLYPSTHMQDPSKTRSVILIRSNISTDSWSQIDINSGDISAILIQGTWGKLAIYNAYIDCSHDKGIEDLGAATNAFEENSRRTPEQQAHTIWLGDFNRHHPHWDNASDNRLFTHEALKKSGEAYRSGSKRRSRPCAAAAKSNAQAQCNEEMVKAGSCVPLGSFPGRPHLLRHPPSHARHLHRSSPNPHNPQHGSSTHTNQDR